MNRRDAAFALIALGAGTQLAPAQQPVKLRRVGFLAARSRSTPSNPDVHYDAFVQAMRDLGYIEGQNLIIEWRYAEGKLDRMPALALELVQAKVEVAVTHVTTAIEALQNASRTIPIVATSISNPVFYGPSMARPSSNVTGMSNYSIDLGPKRVELLKKLLPGLTRVAVFDNPKARTPWTLASFQATAARLGISIVPIEASTPDEIERGFATAIKEQANALIFPSDGLYLGQRRQIAELGLKYRMPSLSPYRETVEMGGLISYGQTIIDNYRKAASYVDKLLRGAKPVDLPIEQSTTIHLAINRKTAKTLGITIPQDLLLRADELIE